MKIHTDSQPFVKDYGWAIFDKAGTSAWAAVLKKFDNFCKMRKDCMFIADGLRPICLDGDAKIVRPTRP